MQRFKTIKRDLKKMVIIIVILLFAQDKSVYASSTETQNLENEYDEIQDAIDGELRN